MSFTIGRTEVVDTFAEAFPMRFTRLVITAATPHWAHEAARSMTGFATSVIGCKCEAAIERVLEPGVGEGTGIGLANVNLRLTAHYGEGVKLRSFPFGTVVRLEVPFAH